MSQSIIDELSWRGLIAQISDEKGMRRHLESGPVSFYCGFDPTADSLHVGSLLPLITMRRFQIAGHRPIVLLGGATGLIGDPSGKRVERTLNDDETVKKWLASLQPQTEQILEFTGNSAATLVNNFDWTNSMSAIEFLRDLGKHFSIGAMIAKESVRSRLGDEAEGISYTEFSYIIIQSNDFLHLARTKDCLVQIGGNDQWGNMTTGIELIHKKLDKQAYVMTVPLLTTAAGTKFGKTESGTVWLDAKRTSPYAFYQYWVNADDRDVVKLLKFFTLLSREEIAALEQSVADAPHERRAQKALAGAMTILVHGQAELDKVLQAAEALFGGGNLREVDRESLLNAIGSAPTVTYDSIAAVPQVLQLLVDAGLADSRSKAREMVTSGGVYVNNERVTDIASQPAMQDFMHDELMVIRRGKKSYAIARLKRD